MSDGGFGHCMQKYSRLVQRRGRFQRFLYRRKLSSSEFARVSPTATMERTPLSNRKLQGLVKIHGLDSSSVWHAKLLDSGKLLASSCTINCSN